MRFYTPGGRFDAKFESNKIFSAVILTTPVNVFAIQWFKLT
jgi:hypothetical protein